MSEFVMQGIVSDLHADLLDVTRMGSPWFDGLAGRRSITFTTRGGSRTFPIPDAMPTPPLGAKVRIIFEVEQ